MAVLYEPKGRAREYGELAVNLYSGGCPHQCSYCYVPAALHKTREAWLAEPCRPRAGVIEQLNRDLGRYVRTHENRLSVDDKPQVFLCFSCDPYPRGVDTETTRRAIEAIHNHGLGVRILTKGGAVALLDLDLLGPRDAFGVTLTSLVWLVHDEPHAAPPAERLALLRAAKERSIPTWVSLEPVLSPALTFACIKALVGLADEVRIGAWNHDPRAAAINRRKFAHDVSALCERLGVRYTLKAELRRLL